MSVLEVLREVYENLSTPNLLATALPATTHGRLNGGLPRAEQGSVEDRIRCQHDCGGTGLPESVKPEPRILRVRSGANGIEQSASKKRRRNRDQSSGEASYLEWTDELMAEVLPGGAENCFATSIFELGLRHSSPKVLMKLMPDAERLTTEHIKSHLQKYRLHYNRSKEEFLEFYELRLKDKFGQFGAAQLWRNLPSHMTEDEATDEPEGHLSALLDMNNIADVQDLSAQVIQEQMQLQQVLQNHIMALIKLQRKLQEQAAALSN